LSIYEDELRRRLMNLGKLQETVDWYLQVCIADNLEWKDASVLEVRFMKFIHDDWEKWMKRRTLN
jgi:acetone carboxylase gamma subunit